MSYTPTQWSAGDTVTSAKLNKMEQGIANAGGANILVAHITEQSYEPDIDPGTKGGASAEPDTILVLDKTAGEILNADFVFVRMEHENEIYYSYISSIIYDEGYTFTMYNGTSLYAETENDYPVYGSGDNGGGK